MDKSSARTMAEAKNQETKSEDKSVVGLLKNFAEDTSLHGLGRLVHSRFIFLRIIWALALMGGAGVAAYNVVLIILTFLQYPVSTVVTMEYSSTTPFPAVTICNLNPLKNSQWKNSVHLQDLRDEDTVDSGMMSLNSTNSTDQYDYDDDFFDAEETANQRYTIQQFLAQMERDARSMMGHQLKDMLLGCSYQEKDCVPENFTSFYDNVYGNCFTFNKEQVAGSVTKPGPTSGLKMVLNVEEDEYSQLAETVGFKVVVHPQATMPFPGDEGVVVTTGLDTHVAVSRLDIKRTEAPYGRCAQYGTPQPHLNMYYTRFDVGYSDKACRTTCLQNSMYKNCKCCHRDYPCYLSNADGSAVNAPYCNYSDVETVTCANSISQSFAEETLGCSEKCLPACRETTYSTEVSIGVWPSLPTHNLYVALMRKRLNDSRIDGSYIINNLVKVQVYYKQLNYEQIKTTPAYNWSRVLSDMGGQMGLWLGFSLLTGLEIVQLLFDITLHLGWRVFCCSRKTLHRNSVTAINVK